MIEKAISGLIMEKQIARVGGRIMQAITHLLYGTSNDDKVKKLRALTAPLGLALLSPRDVGFYQVIPEVEEDCLENARQKAAAYYRATGVPTLSIATALVLEGVAPAHQPGTHIHGRDGIRWNGQQMVDYYAWLVNQYGGQVRARFRNAACVALAENDFAEQTGFDSAHFFIVNKPHKKWKRKDPLAALIRDEKSGECWLDKERFWEYDQAKADFQQFLLRALKIQEG